MRELILLTRRVCGPPRDVATQRVGRDPTPATVEVRFKLARREGFINARLAAIGNVPHTTRAHNISLVAQPGNGDSHIGLTSKMTTDATDVSRNCWNCQISRFLTRE
jgi:hypothetical protein